LEQHEAYKLIEDFYRKNFKRLVNKVKGRAGSYHNAEDVVQEAFTRSLKYHKSYNPAITPFDMWFSRILENSLRTHTKDRRAQGMVYDARPSDKHTGVYTESAFVKRFISEIKDDIALLSEKKKEVLNLSFFYDYSPNDVSKIMNINPGTIRVLIHRFREELKLKYGTGVYC